MQSKPIETTQASPEANGLLSWMDPQDAAYVFSEYELDHLTTICPSCELEVSRDDLVLIADQFSTWTSPMEGHNACPHCRTEISASELEKPSFEYWLKLTA